MLTFLRKHWRWLLVLAALGAGFALGASCRAEPEVRVRDKLVTVEKEVVREAKVHDAAEVKVVWREKVTSPDGTVRESEHATTDTRFRNSTVSAAERIASREVTREEVRATPPPRYEVGLMAGADLGRSLLAPPILVGVRADARLGGLPLKLGVWAHFTPAEPRPPVVGLALTLEIP